MKLHALALTLLAGNSTAEVAGTLNAGADDATSPIMTTAAFKALDVADVSALLAEWNLNGVFGAEFVAQGVDGDTLLHATRNELTEAFAGVSRLHLNRLLRKLEPVWAAAAAAAGAPGRASGPPPQKLQHQQLQEQVIDATGHASGARRLVGDSSDGVTIEGVEFADFSGVRVLTEKAMVQL